MFNTKKIKNKFTRNSKALTGKNIIFAILIIGLLAVGLTAVQLDVLKVVNDDIPLGSTANCKVTVEYYGYYDGVRVNFPVVYAPWEIEGAIVDALGVTISWEATGTYMNWATLGLGGTLKLYRGDYTGQTWTEITSNVGFPTYFTRSGATNLIGSVSYTLPLSTLLSGVSMSGPGYWTVKATITVSGTATDNYGAATSETTGLLTAIYTIYDATGGWELDGIIK